jgi:hypothetical protein
VGFSGGGAEGDGIREVKEESMISEKNAPRLLGAAFLFVFFASLISNVLLTSVVGSGNVSHDLVNVSNQLTRVRLSVLGQMLTSMGIHSDRPI